jgi:hypothetical protein
MIYAAVMSLSAFSFGLLFLVRGVYALGIVVLTAAGCNAATPLILR